VPRGHGLRECRALKSGTPSTPRMTASPSITNASVCFQRGFDNPWTKLGPVTAVPGHQALAVAVALHGGSIAVVFYFVDLVRSMWNLDRAGGDLRSLSVSLLQASYLEELDF